MKKCLMKKGLALWVGALLTGPVLAKDLDTRAIATDVNIMRGILATAVSGDSEERHGPWSDEGIDAWYLASQGVVFRLNTRHFRESSSFNRRIEINTEFLDDINDAVEGIMDSIGDVEMPEPPEPPEPAEPPAFTYHFSAGDDTGAGDVDRKALRAMSEELRAKARVVRERARELQRLENQNDKDDKNAAAISAKRKELDQAKEALRVDRDKQHKLMAEQKAKQEARWGAQLAELETKTITALCNYGGSLRSVPKNEHVTLMLSGAARSERKRQDLVYVFTRQDLADCQSEKLSVAKLKEKGLRYTF